MANTKRGWHNPSKHIEQKTEGKCPYCNKHVKFLESHISDKHKREKLVKKK